MKTKYKNKRVGNYDSKSEMNFALLLKSEGFNFKEKEVFTLQEKFKYMGENIRAITIEPDFTIYKGYELVAIVDTKHITSYRKTKNGKVGVVGTHEWRIKVKMLQYKLQLQGSEVAMFFPVTAFEKNDVIKELKKIISK